MVVNSNKKIEWTQDIYLVLRDLGCQGDGEEYFIFSSRMTFSSKSSKDIVTDKLMYIKMIFSQQQQKIYIP